MSEDGREALDGQMDNLGGSFVGQLATDRRRFRVIGGSSARQQALREAQALGIRPEFAERYADWALGRRREAEAVRAAKRSQREARWRDVQAGERVGLTVSEADALWSDIPDEGLGRYKRAKVAV